MTFRVETEFPIAFDSPDHLYPWGTKRDNNTNEGFIRDIISRFLSDNKVRVIDLGCSGGGLIKNWLDYTEYAIGLEGSDYSVKHERAEWPELHNKNLFTCDVTRPYQIMYDDKPYKANIITAWELIEHIEPTRVDDFFKMIDNHLEVDGIFVGSGTDSSDCPEGQELHLSPYEKSFWDHHAAKFYYQDIPYPFAHSVRTGSYLFCYKKTDPNKLQALF
jgi:predicted TPR repeat methyltransferase